MLLLFLGLLVFLFVVGIPVAFSLGLTVLSVLIVERGLFNIPYEVIAQRLVHGLDSFPLLAVPFFILAGRLMNTSGITKRIFRLANCLVGHLRGGLGHVNVVASMIFAGMSGSATADAAGLGTIEMKAMLDAGFDREFSAGITGASALIGPIIPPSIPMVLYGVLAEVSVGALFMGGFIPGVMMGVALMAMVTYYARKRKYPRQPLPSLWEFWEAFHRAFLSLLTPVIIIGGIWSGIFTPTEAAAVAVAYAFGLGFLVYRELSLNEFLQVITETMKDSAIVMFILTCGSLYGWLLIRYRIPMILTEYVVSLSTNPLIILLIVNGFLLIVGCFMSAAVAINVLTPLLVPLITKVGIDPLHFGVVMVLNLMIGNLTPPFGMVLFVLVKVAALPFDRLVRACFPFIFPIVAVLLLIILFPKLVIYLPSVLMAR